MTMPDSTRVACGVVLERCARREISLPTALMQLLIETEDDGMVESFLRDAASDAEVATRLIELHQRNRSGCARAAAMLHADVDSPEPARTVEEGLAFCRRLFDWAVGESEELSVALYSLGSPELLDRATREIVALLDGYGVLRPHGSRSVLDLGCGIGRVALQLAPIVRDLVAIDVSPRMIDAAKRRLAEFDNVVAEVTEGRDLEQFDSDRFDVVLAVDCMPYVVQSGEALVAKHFQELRRVLRPGGEAIVFNYSYRGDLARDISEIAALADANHFEPLVLGERPFSLWDGAVFRLAKRR